MKDKDIKKEKEEIKKESSEHKESKKNRDDEINELKKEVANLKEKLKECEDNYLRVHADFDNSKKRLEKEKIQAIEYASEKFAQDLLPALDSLDMAISNIDNQEIDPKEAINKLKEGINLTIDQFIKAFNKHGIEVIEIEEGSEFNPHLHEALLQVEDAKKKSGEIVQVIQKGYKYKERILRPAKVSVAKWAKAVKKANCFAFVPERKLWIYANPKLA